MKIFPRLFLPSLLFAAVLTLSTSCSVTKFLPAGATLLDRVSVECDSAGLDASAMKGYIRQHPNSKWFSLFNAPLGIYSLSGRDSTRRLNRFIRKLGQAPVAYDEAQARKTQADILAAVRNLGYLDASVDMIARQKGRRTSVLFHIHPSGRYRVRHLTYQVPDTAIRSILQASRHESLLAPGMHFDLNLLERERSRINTLLLNNGYYKFNKDYIHFRADTAVGGRLADLQLLLRPYRAASSQPHPVFRFGDVDFSLEEIEGMKLRLRPKVLRAASELETGDTYGEDKVQRTYGRLMRLGAVMSANVRLRQDAADSTRLNAHVSLTPSRLNSVNLELEGTNSAGDLGAAISTSYQNRNLFHGSETFSVKLRGAYEAIKGLSGYSDQDYIEYSLEAGIAFPDFKFPFLSQRFKKSAQATSEIRLMYDSQDRPEFHRRVVTAAWRYRWGRKDMKQQHRVDMLDLNYVFMPWISDTFRKLYLEDPDSRNAILKFNYENLFIMKWGYSLTLSSRPMSGAHAQYGTDAYILRLSAESAGNLLYGMSHLFAAKPNSERQFTLFNIAYAQYFKADVDFSKSFRLDERNSLAIHIGLGVTYPYGNSNILPYEKRYFSGGANSVRGWSVRGLGPGSYNGRDGRIDFINQTGDMKLDINAEYRTHLLWKFHGAIFVDAGNIWTIRDYAEQPGGQFRFSTFWKQIAVAYGLGLRLNFDYFILRLDGGMKAVDPAYTDSRRHFPIVSPNFKRDFTLHFAVGLPF